MSKRMKEYKTRKNNRLNKYDYSENGWYFVTICTKNKENIFGEIVGADDCRPSNKIKLNRYGFIVEDELKKTEIIRDEIILDEYVIMPNHIHAIVILNRNRF